jgi:class 3 adenylate cyclase/putative methionine-R-sulfoxide reductase with GAF domain/DNA-binding FrmR family transcriptional regulator
LVQNFAAQAVIAVENSRLLNELRGRTQELTEALEQRTAMSEVLGVISSSPGELTSVFDTILANALRLCDADTGHVLRAETGALSVAASRGGRPEYAQFWRERGPWRPASDSAPAQAMEQKKPVQIADMSQTSSYAAGGPATVAAVELGGLRTVLMVPMIADEKAVGIIVIYRSLVRPFSDKQIALVENFAKQAVIAIENARLLNELRQRTADLSESLEQQTATSEVLKVISSAPGELNAVFEAILSNATRICEATYGNLLLFENGAFRRAAQCNAPQELIEEFQRNPVFVPLPNNPLDRVLKTKEAVHTVDAQADSNLGLLADARTLLNVPMLSHGELIGTISIYRQEVRAFTGKQIDILRNFAAQAVIAVENARLLNELRESLEQQTATADVLRIISSSPGELNPVFNAMLENAVRLCEAELGNLYLYDGEAFHAAALHAASQAYAETRSRRPIVLRELHPDTPLAGIVRNRAVVHTADVRTVKGYIERDPRFSEFVDLSGARTHLAVPVLKENAIIGAIDTYRLEVRPFTDKQIALVQSFAAQAVIAIENARLLSELRHRTEQIAKLNQQLEQRVADQVGEIERMSRLRRFLPPQVADLIVASGTEKQLESHRREITALFCDLRGFTGFSESSDPEDVMALLRDYHAAIGQIIIKYSGTLERYAGDGVMVVFNDPVPVENPALQAVLMALEMRDAIGALTETWHRWGHDIGFGIGIAHGFATLGTIGFEGRFDYAAIGTVSNVASRLCDEAKPGQILINPRVLTKVENAVTVEPVGEFTLKGIRRPMMAYNVLASSPPKPN